AHLLRTSQRIVPQRCSRLRSPEATLPRSLAMPKSRSRGASEERRASRAAIKKALLRWLDDLGFDLDFGPGDRPGLAAVGSVVGPRHHDVLEHGERAGGGGVAAGGDVAEADGSRGGAVGEPGLEDGEAVVGGEEQGSPDGSQKLRGRAAGTGVQVGD